MENKKIYNKFSIEQFYSLIKTDPESIYLLLNQSMESNAYLLEEVIDKQQKYIDTLEKRIGQLEAQINKDSHNSSKPPSSDGLKKKTKSLRKSSGKKSGGQKGHKGFTLKRNPNPDKIVSLKVCNCPYCNENISSAPTIGEEKRQVVDIPPIKIETTEYRAEVKECPHCHNKITASFPENVNSRIQYGDNLRAFQIYFRNQNYIPTKRAAEIFKDVFGVPLSEGTVYNTITDFSLKLRLFQKWVNQQLLQSNILHFDETGMRIDGKLHWVHSISNEKYTLYVPHAKRGNIAMDSIGILPLYKGFAIHDFWKSYLKYKNCFHSLCNAHHLRELTFLYEEEGLQWANEMIELFLKIKEAVYKSISGKLSKKKINLFESLFDNLVQKGYDETPPPKQDLIKKRGRKKRGKALCLLDRFRDKREMVLAFMHNPDVPFDNNLAERDIRMVKVYQKVSGCFRTFKGAENFLLIRSFLSTARKQRKNIINSIVKVINSQNIVDILAE